MKRITLFVLLVLLVPIRTPAQTCPGDHNGDAVVTIDEIVGAVTSAIHGCQPRRGCCVCDMDGAWTCHDGTVKECPECAGRYWFAWDATCENGCDGRWPTQ